MARGERVQVLQHSNAELQDPQSPSHPCPPQGNFPRGKGGDDVTALDRIEPLYEWFDGWKEPTSDARTLEALPANARRYLDRIRELSDAPISYVSVGTKRDQIIGLA